jgi:hypothetical protein
MSRSTAERVRAPGRQRKVICSTNTSIRSVIPALFVYLFIYLLFLDAVRTSEQLDMVSNVKKTSNNERQRQRTATDVIQRQAQTVHWAESTEENHKINSVTIMSLRPEA